MYPAARLRTLTAAAPLAFVAILASAPLASAGISDAALGNTHVLNHGNTLSVMVSSATSDDSTDSATAQNVADAFIGGWASSLIANAMRNTPPSVTTCQAAVTVTDPDGATGSASGAVPVGVATIKLNVPDRAPGTKWGVGDLDHYALQLTCSAQRGNISKVTIDQDEIAGN